MELKVVGKNPMEKELYQRIDEVVHYVWDPIDVNGVPEARDEYYNYLDRIHHLLLSGASDEEVCAHLTTLETESMGLPGMSK